MKGGLADHLSEKGHPLSCSQEGARALKIACSPPYGRGRNRGIGTRDDHGSSRGFSVYFCHHATFFDFRPGARCARAVRVSVSVIVL